MFAVCSSKQPMSSVSVPHIARSYTPASSADKKTRRRRENDVPLFRVHARRPVWVASALQKCKRHCHERFNTFQRVKLANEAREFMLRHVTNEKERWHVLCDAPFSWKNIYSLMNFYFIYLFETNVLQFFTFALFLFFFFQKWEGRRKIDNFIFVASRD